MHVNCLAVIVALKVLMLVPSPSFVHSKVTNFQKQSKKPLENCTIDIGHWQAQTGQLGWGGDGRDSGVSDFLPKCAGKSLGLMKIWGDEDLNLKGIAGNTKLFQWFY